MDYDEEVCLCFHVTHRKLLNYLRNHDVQRASQLSECLGAGTGCGWCRPYLQQIWEAADGGSECTLPDSQQYAEQRAAYVRAGHGTPPKE